MIPQQRVQVDGCTVDYFPRGWWTALESKAILLPPRDFIGWVEHHTVMVMPDYDRDGFTHGDLDDIKRYMERLRTIRPDLGGEVPYNVICFQGTNPKHGIVVEGRGIYRKGAHTAGLNSTRMSWSIAGDTRSSSVSDGMVAAMRWIAGESTPWANARTIGHQQAPPYYQNGTNLNATACPGPGGMAAVPRLQPPFVTTPPTPGDLPMSAAEVNEIKAEIAKLAQGQLAVASATQAPYTQVSIGDGTIYVIVWSGDQPVKWGAPGPAPLSMLINAGLVEPNVRTITGGEAEWVKKLHTVDGLEAFKPRP